MIRRCSSRMKALFRDRALAPKRASAITHVSKASTRSHHPATSSPRASSTSFHNRQHGGPGPLRLLRSSKHLSALENNDAAISQQYTVHVVVQLGQTQAIESDLKSTQWKL